MIGTEWLRHMDTDAQGAVNIIEDQALRHMKKSEDRETAIKYLLHILALHGHVDLVDGFIEMDQE